MIFNIEIVCFKDDKLKDPDDRIEKLWTVQKKT